MCVSQVRVIQQFFPETWDTFRWHALESPKRWFVVVLVYVCVLVVDFNAFALKYILWIPPRNPLNVYRLVHMIFLCVGGVKFFWLGAGLCVCGRPKTTFTRKWREWSG